MNQQLINFLLTEHSSRRIFKGRRAVMKFRFHSALTSFALAICSSSAQAVVTIGGIPLVASTTGSIFFTGPDLTSGGGSQVCQGYPLNCFATAASVNANGGPGTASVIAQGFNPGAPGVADSYLSASISTAPGQIFQGLQEAQAGTAQATLFYFVKVTANDNPTAPPSLASGPLTLTGNISTSGFTSTGGGNGQSGNGAIQLFAIIDDPSAPPLSNLVELYSNYTPGNFSFDYNFGVEVPILVKMSVTATSESPSAASSAFATVDPVFSLSPQDAANFHIEYSSNFLPAAPAAGVPEPATWAMMLAGLGAIGASMRHRRRSTKALFA